jgi:signal recognition particle receptor subunit alpha
MLDTFEIVTTSGVVLWSRTYAPVGANVINSLIRDVFIEERIQPQAEDTGSKPTYRKEGYTLKWTAAKDLGLIFVAVYQSLVHLTWIDRLLDNVRALFVGLYGEQLKTQHSSVVNCDKFGSYFDRQMHDLEGANDSSTPSIRVATPPSSTDNESADELSPAPPLVNKPQRALYDTSADSTPIPTPDTSRPNTPGQSSLLVGRGRPAGSKLSRRDKKKVSALTSGPVSSGDEASGRRKGKGGAKKNRTWGEFGAEEQDDTVLDYSQADLREGASENEALEEIRQDTWGRKTNKGEFVLKDLDEEMDAIISAQNAKKDKETLAAPGGIVGSSIGAIGGLFRNVVGGKTLTKEDLVKPLKGMEEHLLKKNVALEAAVRLCDSVERDLVGMKTPNFTSTFLQHLVCTVSPFRLLTLSSNRIHPPHLHGESTHQDPHPYLLARPPPRNHPHKLHFPAPVRSFHRWRQRRRKVDQPFENRLLPPAKPPPRPHRRRGHVPLRRRRTTARPRAESTRVEQARGRRS